MRLRAFTLIEVLATLLVLGLGMAAAVGLFTYGLKLSIEAQARATAQATAATVAIDANPLLDPDLISEWTVGTYDFDANDSSALSQGIINGWFVQRRESTTAADIVAKDGPKVFLRSVHVEVDVFDTRGSRLVASLSSRFLRQRNGP